MIKSLKIIGLFVLIFFLFGCSNSNHKEEIFSSVQNSSYEEISTKLDQSILNITMFPTEEEEDDFIYYVMAIKENRERFSLTEREELYNKLNIRYNFSYNSLDYTRDLYLNDIKMIKE